MNYGRICILILAITPAVFSDTNYCDANLCDESKKHIACENNGDFAQNCILPQIINITSKYGRLIIRKHNLLRSKISRGLLKFPPASRMATMLWDVELANLAEFNVKKCKVSHDQCRNTPKFSFAGQNIVATRWKGMNLNETEITESQILQWFNGYKYCPWDIIKRYTPSNYTSCDRFTTMVQDKSTHIGCAILRSFSRGHTEQFMTCNYAYGNKLGAPVYAQGKTGAQCTTGFNSRYTSLCSVKEKYN